QFNDCLTNGAGEIVRVVATICELALVSVSPGYEVVARGFQSGPELPRATGKKRAGRVRTDLGIVVMLDSVLSRRRNCSEQHFQGMTARRCAKLLQTDEAFQIQFHAERVANGQWDQRRGYSRQIVSRTTTADTSH